MWMDCASEVTCFVRNIRRLESQRHACTTSSGSGYENTVVLVTKFTSWNPSLPLIATNGGCNRRSRYLGLGAGGVGAGTEVDPSEGAMGWSDVEVRGVEDIDGAGDKAGEELDDGVF